MRPGATVLARRIFFKTGAAALLTMLLPIPASAGASRQQRFLSLYNIHTGESLKTCYRSRGHLIHRALDRINHIMRDHRTGEVKPVDPALLDLLHRVTTTMHAVAPISVISGYRSPQTNAALRKITDGVARKSLHMEGRAIDIRIPGCSTDDIRHVAADLKRGGVGYYPASNFVHLDTGPFKVW